MKKGFTLVELMVVIAVIGILAASLFPATVQYLARARDAAKVNEINQLQTAIEVYHIDKETYLISGAGYMGQGEGWVNYSGTSYPSSMFAELKKMGYLGKNIKQKAPSDLYLPAITSNKSPCTGLGFSTETYMFFFNDSLDRYSLSAYLESPTDKNIAATQASYNGNALCNAYGRNYAVGK